MEAVAYKVFPFSNFPLQRRNLKPAKAQKEIFFICIISQSLFTADFPFFHSAFFFFIYGLRLAAALSLCTKVFFILSHFHGLLFISNTHSSLRIVFFRALLLLGPESLFYYSAVCFNSFIVLSEKKLRRRFVIYRIRGVIWVRRQASIVHGMSMKKRPEVS